MYQAIASINQNNLQHNARQVIAQYPQSFIFFVLKTDAYSHDIAIVSKALSELSNKDNAHQSGFAVCDLNDALFLRSQFPKKRILLLQGFETIEDLQTCVDFNIESSLHHPHQLEKLKLFSKTAKKETNKKSIKVWAKINSGMNRLGLSESQLSDGLSVIKSVESLSGLLSIKVMGLMTHLAQAEQADSPFTQKQLQIFQAVANTVPIEKVSVANSAAIIHHLVEDHSNQVIRPGIMLYGLSPVADNDFNLKPVMTLHAGVISIHSVAQGETVGYGAVWQANKPSLIAIVRCGYADGYPRSLPSGTQVYCNQHFYPLAGRVSMDMTAIDITTSTDYGIPINIGDRVEFWGENIHANQLAESIGTIAYELVTGVHKRVARV